MYIIISIYILYLYYLSILKLSLNTVFVMKKENVWTRTQNDASSKKIPRRTQRSRRGQCWWRLWLSLPERRFSRSATRISPTPFLFIFSHVAKYWSWDHAEINFRRIIPPVISLWVFFRSMIDSIFLMVRETWGCQIDYFHYCITIYSIFNNFRPKYLKPLGIWNRSWRIKLFKVKFQIG